MFLSCVADALKCFWFGICHKGCSSRHNVLMHVQHHRERSCSPAHRDPVNPINSDLSFQAPWFCKWNHSPWPAASTSDPSIEVYPRTHHVTYTPTTIWWYVHMGFPTLNIVSKACRFFCLSMFAAAVNGPVLWRNKVTMGQSTSEKEVQGHNPKVIFISL